MHVFAYGTLMLPQVWSAVVGRSFATIGGQVDGFAIYRVRGELYPGIVAAAGHTTRGVVHLDVDKESASRLDLFEDDFYRRQYVSVVCDDGRSRRAQVYVIPTGERARLSEETWELETFVAQGHAERFLRSYRGFERLKSGGAA